MSLVLGTTKEEISLCCEAFMNAPPDAVVLHCHHEILGERLTQGAEHRIDFILNGKNKKELPLRLRLFRPVPPKILKKYEKTIGMSVVRKKVQSRWQKAHAELRGATAKLDEVSIKCTLDACGRRVDGRWLKAYDYWQKKLGEAQMANGYWQIAYTSVLVSLHMEICKDCPWNGLTIFP